MQAFPPLPSRTSPRILVAPFPFAKETSQQSRLFPPPSRDLERQQKKQLSGTIYHPQRDPLDILRRNASKKRRPSLLACHQVYRRIRREFCHATHHLQNPPIFGLHFTGVNSPCRPFWPGNHCVWAVAAPSNPIWRRLALPRQETWKCNL